MARRPIQPESKAAVLSPAAKVAGIAKLGRRLEELNAIRVDQLTEIDSDDTLDAVRQKIDATLIDVFGEGTLDYRRYRPGYMDESPINMMTGRPDISERRPYIESGIRSARVKLQTAIDLLKEGLEETSETGAARTLKAYQGLDLHSEIARAASGLFRDGHYASAIEDAVKALNSLVRLRSGLDFDGTTLMERAFAPSGPVLRFNELKDQNDKDEQKGFMMMFGGAVAGLRNPRAHRLMKDDPERALEFIAYVSLLAKLLDGAERVRSP